MLRRCPVCEIEKPLTDFHYSTKNQRVAGYCKPCNKIKCKEYDAARKARDPAFAERERERSQRQRSTRSYRVYMTWQRHLRTATKRGRQYDLTQADVMEMFVKNEWRCCKTGIEFDISTGRGIRPFSPSIDRIDSSKGYFKGNVQLVCTIYNFAKNKFSETEVIAFAAALIKHECHAG